MAYDSTASGSSSEKYPETSMVVVASSRTAWLGMAVEVGALLSTSVTTGGGRAEDGRLATGSVGVGHRNLYRLGASSLVSVYASQVAPVMAVPDRYH